MKIRLMVGLVVLAMGFALPTFAQEKNAVAPKYVSRLKLYLRSFKRRIINTTRLLWARYTRKTLLRSGRGKGLLPVGKPSRKGLHSTLHRILARWSPSSFRCTRSARTSAQYRIRVSEDRRATQ